MEVFEQPVSQVIADLSAFERAAHSIIGNDKGDVLAAFKAFVGAVEAFAKQLHHQLQNENQTQKRVNGGFQGTSTAVNSERAGSIVNKKADLLLQSGNLAKVADNAVSSIRSLKRLAFDLQHRTSELRKAIDRERVKSLQQSKEDEAALARIEKELETCLASLDETNTKLRELEKTVSDAEEARSTMRIFRFASWGMATFVPVLGVPLAVGGEIYARFAREERRTLKLQKESAENEASMLNALQSSMLKEQTNSVNHLTQCEKQLANAVGLLDHLHKNERKAIDMESLDALKQAASRFVHYVQDLEGDVHAIRWAEASSDLQENVRLLVEGMSKIEDQDLALVLRPLKTLVGLDSEGASCWYFVWFFCICWLACIALFSE